MIINFWRVNMIIFNGYFQAHKNLNLIVLVILLHLKSQNYLNKTKKYDFLINYIYIYTIK
jgi:hypothetical protein